MKTLEHLCTVSHDTVSKIVNCVYNKELILTKRDKSIMGYTRLNRGISMAIITRGLTALLVSLYTQEAQSVDVVWSMVRRPWPLVTGPDGDMTSSSFKQCGSAEIVSATLNASICLYSKQLTCLTSKRRHVYSIKTLLKHCPVETVFCAITIVFLQVCWLFFVCLGSLFYQHKYIQLKTAKDGHFVWIQAAH